MQISRGVSLCLCLVVFVAAAYSQSAKFDIVAYTAPAGWVVEKKPTSIRFSKDSGESFCVISLARSADSMGDSAKDFMLIWKAMAIDVLNVKAEPQMGKPGKKDGWDAEVGLAPFEKEGLKGAALLTTFTGNGKVVAVLAITNSDAFEKDIETFVDNVKLPAITVRTTPTPAAPVDKP